MKNSGILLLVFGPLVFITLVATFASKQGDVGNFSGFAFMIIMLCGVGVEVAILLILGSFFLLKGRIIKRDPGKMPVMTPSDMQQNKDHRMRGKKYLLYAGLVLLIGCSICLGGAFSLAGFNSK